MKDTVIMQDRIGQLCGQFKMPTADAPVGGPFHRGWTRRRPGNLSRMRKSISGNGLQTRLSFFRFPAVAPG